MKVKIELPKIRGYLRSEAQTSLDTAVSNGWIKPYADGYLMPSHRGDVGLSRDAALKWAAVTVPKIQKAMYHGRVTQNSDGSFNVAAGPRGTRMLTMGLTKWLNS